MRLRKIETDEGQPKRFKLDFFTTSLPIYLHTASDKLLSTDPENWLLALSVFKISPLMNPRSPVSSISPSVVACENNNRRRWGGKALLISGELAYGDGG